MDNEIGGNHYEKLTIEPFKVIVEENMSFVAGNIVKYIARHTFKNKQEDIEKAYWYLDHFNENRDGVYLKNRNVENAFCEQFDPITKDLLILFFRRDFEKLKKNLREISKNYNNYF